MILSSRYDVNCNNFICLLKCYCTYWKTSLLELIEFPETVGIKKCVCLCLDHLICHNQPEYILFDLVKICNGVYSPPNNQMLTMSTWWRRVLSWCFPSTYIHTGTISQGNLSVYACNDLYIQPLIVFLPRQGYTHHIDIKYPQWRQQT